MQHFHSCWRGSSLLGLHTIDHPIGPPIDINERKNCQMFLIIFLAQGGQGGFWNLLLGEKFWQQERKKTNYNNKITHSDWGSCYHVLSWKWQGQSDHHHTTVKALQGNLGSLYFVPIRRNVAKKAKTETVPAQLSLNLSWEWQGSHSDHHQISFKALQGNLVCQKIPSLLGKLIFGPKKVCAPAEAT